MDKNIINSINLNANTDFPYLVLKATKNNIFPRNAGFRLMHWHEDLQFIYVEKGFITIHTLNDKPLTVNAFSGIFINKNVAHLINCSSDSQYRCFIFPDYFLKFYLGSPAEKYVSMITENENIFVYPLSVQVSWQNEILSYLKILAKIHQEKTAFYEYEILSTLCNLWLCFIKNIHLLPKKQNHIISKRMQIFLSYIQKHYAVAISLQDLASTAHVSKTECLRCFKTTMQTTPYRYLKEFRLFKATLLLQNTDKTIDYIATLVGFNQTSYFIKCFKEKMNCTPYQYRKKLHK